MSRTLQPGSVEYVWATITDTTGQDLTDVTVELATARFGEPPTTWLTPALTEHTNTVIRAALLVTAAKGTWSVHARLTDNPETPILSCGYYGVP